MNEVSAQVSLYPLRQPHLGPVIEKAMQAFRGRQSLEIQSGRMSTLIGGQCDQVFEGLKEAFRAAAALGDVVMVVTLSSACPSPKKGQDGNPPFLEEPA